MFPVAFAAGIHVVGGRFSPNLAAPSLTPTLAPDLWENIRRFELDDPAARLSFTDRLARENGWPLDFALRAVLEYKRFMFLLCVTDHPLTPSDEVDQVWHLHLLYTRSYWLNFCQQVLQRPIHHGPTRGGSAERDKFNDWYSLTLARYTEVFGAAPPADLWPAPAVRFGALQFERVNRAAYWLLPKFSLLWLFRLFRR